MIDSQQRSALNSYLRQAAGQDLTPAQRDQIRAQGDHAEALLANQHLTEFLYHFRFTVMDALSGITSHDADANARRIALANQLSGIDAFQDGLRRAVSLRNRVVNTQSNSVPRASHKETQTP